MSDTQGFILVVDDNEMNRDMLSRRLHRLGHEVAVAEDGERALEVMREQSFDLVLLDIMMPKMNGYEVLEQAKADDALRRIPVIMISAVDDLDSVVKCIELGAEDYLFKPFNPVLLKARVGASLEKKQLFDQRALAGANDAAGEKSKLITTIAGELQMLLSSINTSSESLLSGTAGPVSDQQAVFLERIATNTNRGLSYLEKLSDISQLDAGLLQLRLVPVVLASLIDDVVHANQSLLETSGHTLNIEIAPTLPGVQVDKKRTRQILNILLDNALLYTPTKGQITVSAEHPSERGGEDFVCVILRDSGIGVQPEEKDQVFQPEFRSTNPQAVKARQGGGTGMSLHLAKRLVELQGGQIWFDSEPEKGTTFRFTIPVG